MEDKNESKIKNLLYRFKDLTQLGSANIISTGISAVFWFYMAAILGTTHYGEVSYFIAIAGIASTISFLGMGSTLIVYTSKGVKIQSSLNFIGLISGTVTSIILFLIFFNIGVSLYTLGYVIFGLATSEILGRKLYGSYSKYLITQRIIASGLAIGFYFLMGPSGVILGYGISFFPYVFRIYKTFRETKIDFSLTKTKFGFMMNSYALDLSRVFSGSTDKLIVYPLFGFAILGNYQLGIQVLSLLGLLPSIVFQYILPHDASGNPNKKLKKITVMAACMLAVLAIILSPIVIPILFPKFEHAVRIIQIMSLASIPTSINLMYISRLLGNEKNRLVLIGSGIYLASQVSSIFILGKFFGVNGIAGSIVIAASAECLYLLTIDRYIIKKNQNNLVQQPNSDPPFHDNSKEVIQNSNNLKLINKKGLLKKLDFFINNSWISILVICVIGLILRLHYFPYDVPLIQDALKYFFYATDTSILGRLPLHYPLANNGWPIFLSFFFMIFRFDNALDYMTIQRIIAVLLSVATVIPVYLLCRRFFEKRYAIIGAAIFAFDPRLVQNSPLGITEPLFILSIAIGFVLFFSQSKKLVYLSFVIIALSSLVRSEGFVIFFPLIGMFFVRFRKEKKIILKIIVAIGLFSCIVLPMAIFRMHTQGIDTLSSNVVGGSSFVINSTYQKGLSYIVPAMEKLVKFSGWSLVPIFIFLAPPGLFLMLRERNQKTMTILIVMIFMMLPVFFAFYVAPDTRYIYPLFPLFCILSIFTIKKLEQRIMRKNLLLVFVISLILLASISFLEIKKPDYIHQRESFKIAQVVDKIAKGVNDYYPEDGYLVPAAMPEKWPVLTSTLSSQTTIIPTNGFDSLEKYINSSKNQGLTDLVVDGNKNRPGFLNNVFNHEENYPYLKKVFDSSEHGYKYHVKIYMINYSKFNALTETAKITK